MYIALPLVLFVFLPLAMLILLKTNAGMMFLAACTGLVLLNNLDDVVVTTAGAVVPGDGEAYVRLAVVLLTVVFSALVFRNTVDGGIMFLHGLIVLCLGAVLWLILPGATGLTWLLESASQDWWRQLNDYRALIITVGFALSLTAVLLSRSKHRRNHK